MDLHTPTRSTAPRPRDDIRASLDRLHERMDRLEAALSQVTEVLEQVPAVVATTTDIVDEIVQERDLDVDARLRGAAQLAEQLSDPAVMATLGRLAGRLDKLEPLVEAAAELPGLSAAVVDIIDAWAGEQAAQGVDLDTRLRGVARLALRLSDPDVLAIAEKALSRVDQLNEALDTLDMLPGVVATASDIFDEVARAAAREGVELGSFGHHLFTAGLKMARTIQNVDLDLFFETGPFSPESLVVVGQLGRTLVDIRREEPGKVGVWGAMKATRDPDVQRATDFGVRFARRFGQLLQRQLPSP